MNLTDRNAHVRALLDEVMATLEAKGRDYSPTGAAFHNFERIAALCGNGISREVVLKVLLAKHIVTIYDGVSTTEPMRGRTVDAIAYLGLGDAMRAELS